MKKQKKQKILIAWDYNKEEYVWATTPHDLQVKSPGWGHDYRDVLVSKRQLDTLRDGGWIAAVTKKGIRVRI